ncbi:protein of unknown function [Methanoculleus bourgensis]|uniref:Uncharacterized protein n=1 Tax=Methanoculleus bourgensis TaxID=83986 RepID=A0A0X3BMT4_9EURY|nr:protein of unknown function [Methanoculleus bourgensis]
MCISGGVQLYTGILLMEIVHGPTGPLCACRFHSITKRGRAEQKLKVAIDFRLDTARVPTA